MIEPTEPRTFYPRTDAQPVIRMYRFASGHQFSFGGHPDENAACSELDSSEALRLAMEIADDFGFDLIQRE